MIIKKSVVVDHDARYSKTAITLHWLCGFLVIALFCVGLVMSDMELSPAKIEVVSLHKWFGIIFLALTIFRLLWRLTHPAPVLPNKINKGIVRWLHFSTIITFYLLFLAIPLFGWLMSNAAGHTVTFFNIFKLPQLVMPNSHLACFLHQGHELTAWCIIVLLVLHVTAVFKHQFLDKHSFIRRMWWR
jgi:cytochrome b561